MRLINLTPHPLTLIGADGTVLVDQAPDGPMARCAEDRRDLGAVTITDGITVPLRSVGFGAVTGLPAPRDGVLYVVSRSTAETARRDDVVYPDEQVRDESGRIIGCRALARAHN